MVRRKNSPAVTKLKGLFPKGFSLSKNKRPRKHVPAKTVIETALRKDFSRQVSFFVQKFAANPLAKNLRLPEAREHGFAKTPGFKPVDISVEKLPNFVLYKDLLKHEKISTHTHNRGPLLNSANPSIIDLASFVEIAHVHGKKTAVINVFDLGSSYGDFSRLVSVLKYEAGHRRKLGKPLVTKAELRELKQLGIKIANEFRISGNLFMQPTKNLLEMSPDKRRKLVNLLNKRVNESHNMGGRQYSELRASLDKHIADHYGKLFRPRYVPSKGYVYMHTRRAFMKANS